MDTLAGALNLPSWAPPLALFLLIIGFPIVLATAFVQVGGAVAGSTEQTEAPDRQRVPETATRSYFTWRNAMLGGIVAVALWGVIVTAWLVIQGRPLTESASSNEAVSRSRVAVFPFSVRGNQAFHYLSEGMVDLLSTKLDGAGELRSVDARALLAAVGREPDRAVSPLGGRAIAAQFEAGLFILGSIVEAGGRLQVEATLYDVARLGEPVARAQAEGEASRLFEIVDNLTAQLIGDLSGGPGERMTRIAALTTPSLPALKAYLDGERRFRAGDFGGAIESFQLATREDTAFALAYYRLSLAAEYHLAGVEVVQAAAEQAVRHGDRLSEHDRRLLVAFNATRSGDADAAERSYRAIVADYPDDTDAWFQLAEVLFHYGPLQGRAIAEARQAWERVLAIEPDNTGALIHLVRIAAIAGEEAELDSLVALVLALNPESERTLEMRALRVLTLRDEAALQELVAELGDAGFALLPTVVWSASSFTANLDAARRLAMVMTDPSRPAEGRGLGHIWAAHLDLASGRWSSAKDELARAEDLTPALALEYSAVLSASPFLPVRDTELKELRRRLEAWDAAATPPSSLPGLWLTTDEVMHPGLRLYLLGLLSVRLGESQEARRHLAELEAMDGPSGAGSLKEDLVRDLRARLELGRGRLAEALSELEATRREAWYLLSTASGFYSQALSRYTRALALQEAGRYEEALIWFGSFGAHTVYSLPYLAPSHLWRARILEELERPAEASHHYQRFLELWAGADPELEPLVEEAKAGLDELRAS